MAVITHRLNDGTDKALCGAKLSCVPGANVWHILLTAQDFNDDEITQGTRCADCADIQAARDKKSESEIIREILTGNARVFAEESQIRIQSSKEKADLKAAFKIVEERDKEIARLRQDFLRVERKLKQTEDSLEGATDAGAAMILKIAKLTQENVRLENELRYAKAENAPLARQNQRLAKNRDILVDALNAIDNTVKDARETLKDLVK